MIRIVQSCTKKNMVLFYTEGDERLSQWPEGIRQVFNGKYLDTFWVTGANGHLCLLAGMGKPDGDKIHVKELGAKAVKECKERKIKEFGVELAPVMEHFGTGAVGDFAEGAVLGGYEQRMFKGREKEKDTIDIELCSISENQADKARALLADALAVTEGISFARDMANLPGNKLRPLDFAKKAVDFIKDLDVEAEVFEAGKLREMGMDALLGVGDSSEYPPCMLVLRYKGAPDCHRITGLAGKGVTCDTGGYCLKPSRGMLGIKGDMAGGAAVVGAVYALAKNKVKTNAVAVIPMCENRISSGSLLPGDVIGSYGGKTIEIANTDAEGRLILADAAAYAVREEQVTEIVDIATLTGAVVHMLGFSVAGALCDNEELYRRFTKAYEASGERYVRLPFYREHEKMIESKIADIKNMGDKNCGSITAGLFIREFAENKPWLHLDIAGTAWVDSPVFEFQAAGATGAGTASIYRLCCGEDYL